MKVITIDLLREAYFVEGIAGVVTKQYCQTSGTAS